MKELLIAERWSELKITIKEHVDEPDRKVLWKHSFQGFYIETQRPTV